MVKIVLNILIRWLPCVLQNAEGKRVGRTNKRAHPGDAGTKKETQRYPPGRDGGSKEGTRSDQYLFFSFHTQIPEYKWKSTVFTCLHFPYVSKYIFITATERNQNTLYFVHLKLKRSFCHEIFCSLLGFKNYRLKSCRLLCYVATKSLNTGHQVWLTAHPPPSSKNFKKIQNQQTLYLSLIIGGLATNHSIAFRSLLWNSIVLNINLIYLIVCHDLLFQYERIVLLDNIVASTLFFRVKIRPAVSPLPTHPSSQC